jgi:hypothetical protein
VAGNGLLLLRSEGGGALTHLWLIQVLACSRDESFQLSVRGSGGSLSCGRGVVLLPLGGDGLLPVDGGEVGVAARHD